MNRVKIGLSLAACAVLALSSCAAPRTSVVTTTVTAAPATLTATTMPPMATVTVTGGAVKTATMVVTIFPPENTVPETMTFSLPTTTVKPSTTPKPPVTTLVTVPSTTPLTITPDWLLPDLWLLEPFQFFILRDPSTGDRWLFFDTTVVNTGTGPLEMRGAYDAATNLTRAMQRVFTAKGASEDRIAGYFTYHPEHDHWHFDNFAVFELFSADGSVSVVSSQKQSFCIIDTARLISPPEGSPASPVYPECDPVLQGISVGWADIYDVTLPGQQVNIEGLPDGRYTVRMTVDPEGRILETDDGNNVTTFIIEIAGTRVFIIPSAGS